MSNVKFLKGRTVLKTCSTREPLGNLRVSERHQRRFVLRTERDWQ